MKAILCIQAIVFKMSKVEEEKKETNFQELNADEDTCPVITVESMCMNCEKNVST